LLRLDSLETTTYHPAYGLVGGFLLGKSSQSHRHRNVDTGGGVEDLHGLIDLFHLRGTLL
jgi:hypothetical protein